MATRLKGNRGYYTLVLLETLYSSLQVGLTLALVNLPMALVATAVDFAGNMVSGVVMGPKKAAPVPAIAAAPSPEKSPLQTTKSFIKKFWTYNKNCVRDPHYSVGASAASAGITAFFMAAFGIKSLLATHSIAILEGITLTGLSLPMGLGIGAILAAAGLFSIVAGNLDKWKGISKYYHTAFGKEPPATTLKNGQKNFMRRIFDHPLLNNRAARTLRKVPLIALTVQSSLFALTQSASIITHSVRALMASSPAALLAAIEPVTVAGIWGWKAGWHLFSAGRIALGSAVGKIFNHAKAQRAKNDNSTSAALHSRHAPKMATAPALPQKPLTGSFEQAQIERAHCQNSEPFNHHEVKVPTSKINY